ncbi:MAG TPA: glucuronate isomerase [Devosiaceae bacterium]
MALHPDRLLPIEPEARGIARTLYNSVKALPIVSPHGHTDPNWYADNEAFSDPVSLFVKPDHYIFRMLYSQGVSMEAMGIPDRKGEPKKTDDRAIWRLFAKNFYLFRGTPSRMWFEHALEDIFGIYDRLTETNADSIYDRIMEQLGKPELRPRALYERFNIEAISTTDGATETLAPHDKILASGWKGRVLPAYRPDFVIDPEREGVIDRIAQLVALAGTPLTWSGYLDAHRIRRAYFKQRGATSTDHGHPTAHTENLSKSEAEALFNRVMKGNVSPEDAERFRGQMLTEMARMSLEDGLVMQIHPGAWRNHNRDLFAKFGTDKGADIPAPTDYVKALKPLLDEVGNRADLTLILFTLDETSYSRELAPLAGHYPALRLGPAWWFFDSPDGMRRYRELVTETAGFYNTVGFNDDTRAYLSIPARHDMSRRVDCSFLAQRVADHRMDIDEAHEVAHDLAYGLAKKAYKL